MSFLDAITAKLPFLSKSEGREYFFALNVGVETISACLWTIEGKNLKVINPVSLPFSSPDELIELTDRLLDKAVGGLPYEPEKILFGVPDSWLLDDNLKDPYVKLLRDLIKTLGLSPVAYVATSLALSHFLEIQEGAPTTAILVGVFDQHIVVTTLRAGKSDGTKLVKRGDSLGEDIEKATLSFTEVEVLPSRILLYGQGKESLEKIRSDLLSFPWMNKLSFLHLPKIEILEEGCEVKATALAGAVEMEPNVKYSPSMVEMENTSPLRAEQILIEEETPPKKDQGGEKMGFVAGDITQVQKEEETLPVPQRKMEMEEEEPVAEERAAEKRFNLPLLDKFSQIKLGGYTKFLPIAAIVVLVLAYLILSQASVKIFVEPKILEKDTQVTADPAAKKVDEDKKIIPGQIVETEVSGKESGQATGKKQVGDPAKGTAVIYNKTYEAKTFTKGTTLTSSTGLKFSLDSTVNVASQSAVEGGITFGKATASVTALGVGADGNLPSDTEFTVAGFVASQVSAKAEGNFSGGTSREVTVVTDADQKKLLASLAAGLRRQAQEKLQSSLKDKKILEEALSEEIIKKSYSKNINDQAAEFSLNLTIKFKGTAYLEQDLKLIVSKILGELPADFELNLAETETQADVSKLEKDGKLIFLARFRAKLIPKLDQDKIRKSLRGQTPQKAAEILRSYENVLGSEIKITPSLLSPLARLPLLARNIKLEVTLK